MTTKRTLVFFALASVSFATAWGKTFELDLRQAAEDGAKAGSRLRSAASPSDGDGKVRSYNLDAGAAEIGEVAVGDKISLSLFDDVVLTLTLSKQMPSCLGGEVFLAEVEGYRGIKSAVVLRTGDGLTVDVQDFLTNRMYKVISAANGVRVQEIEPTGEVKCGCDSLASPSATSASGKKGLVGMSDSRAGRMLLGVQSDTCIDILVAYDRFAAQWADAYGGGITNFAQVAVAKMNTAIANTGLDARFWFRLVGVMTVSVSASDVHEALYAIDDGESGWADIRAFREVVGADIVTTMIDTGSPYGTTGVGWSLEDELTLTSFGDNAYNVCAVRSVAQTHTMTHECGHNMGAGHSTVQSTQPGPQLYDYSSGFYFTGSDGRGYCTIMAYASDGPRGEQVPYFSSPSYSYAGAAVGDSTHDNTRTLAETYSYVANWRAQKTPMSYQVAFEPASGTLFDGSLAVTLAPGMPDTPIRYTLDGSDPTPYSPLYESPILITGTTTIKASTVIDGVCSIPFTATYYSKNDIGYATGLPELTWRVSVTGSSSLGVQTDNAIDGVAIGAEVDEGDVCFFSTSVTGPATISWQRQVEGSCSFVVLVDGVEYFADPLNGYSWIVGCPWEEQMVDIPSGIHEVKFCLGDAYAYGDGTYSFDDFHMYHTPKPRILPEPSDPYATSYDFSGDELMVSVVSDVEDAIIYYTLDGSDPNDEGAIMYDGPFFISESTKVRAIASRPGPGSSMVVEGVFFKRNALRAGEWTLSGSDAYEAVQSSGRMMAVLCWNYLGCSWSERLAQYINDPAFLLWAELNGVYLLADSWGDLAGDGWDRFWPLYGQTALYEELGGGVWYPTFAFASGSDVDTCLGAMLARNDNEHTVNGIYYRDSVGSLVECFGSFLDTAKPLGPPVVSAENAFGLSFPFAVYLSNTNYAGTIYYTLDGSAPTRQNGIPYTGGPIDIPSSGTTLKAVVWPLDSNAVSGVPLSITYNSFDDAIGVPGVSWVNDERYPWTIAVDGSGPVLNAGRDTSITSGSVTSTLRATVSGPGEFSFSYYLYKYVNNTSLSLKIDGRTVATWNLDVDASTNIVVSSDGPTVFEWVYTYPYRENAYAVYSKCQLSEIAWTPHVAPAVPDGLTVSGEAYEYGTLLRWSESRGADEYVVYRSRSASWSSATRIGSTRQLRYWDTTAGGEMFYYWVSASNAYGEGPAAGPAASPSAGSYRIAFYPGAEGAEGSMPEQIVEVGKVAKLNPCTYIAPAGKRFAGWRRVDTGRRYDDGVLVFNLAGPGVVVVMEAVWE